MPDGEPGRWLWLAGAVPHPADSGLTVYSAALSEALAEAGQSVSGLGIRREGGPGATLVRWTSVAGSRRPPVLGIPSRLPSTSFSYSTPAFRRALDEALQEPLDVVVVDHLQSGWALPRLLRWRRERPGRRLVHVAHNSESTVRTEVAREQGPWSPRRAVLAWDARKVVQLEKRLAEECDVVTTISPEDRKLFESVARGRVLELRPGWSGRPIDAREITAATPRAVAVLGHWDWHVKQSNLEGFLARADDVLIAAGIGVVVVGPAPEAWSARLQQTYPNVTFTGWVDDLDAVMADVRMGLVIEALGGGFKMKALDYVFRRVPMSVLTGSVSGLELDEGDAVLAWPDERALAEGVVGVLDDLPRLNAMQKAAFDQLRDLTSWKPQGAALAAAAR